MSDCQRLPLLLPAMLWLSLLGSPVCADPGDSDNFRSLVEQATEAYGKGDFAAAAGLAEQAYAIKQDPRLLYNLARAREGQGDLDAAEAAYRRYLEADPNTSDREIVTGRIKALQAQRAEQARLRKEREALKRSKSDKGRSKPGSAPHADRTSSPMPWILIGVGGAALATGVGLGLMSEKRHRQAEDARTGEDAQTRLEQGDRFATLANVAFIAGGALCTGGVVWLVLQPSSSASGDATQAWLGVRGRFQ